MGNRGWEIGVLKFLLPSALCFEAKIGRKIPTGRALELSEICNLKLEKLGQATSELEVSIARPRKSQQKLQLAHFYLVLGVDRSFCSQNGRQVPANVGISFSGSGTGFDLTVGELDLDRGSFHEAASSINAVGNLS